MVGLWGVGEGWRLVRRVGELGLGVRERRVLRGVLPKLFRDLRGEEGRAGVVGGDLLGCGFGWWLSTNLGLLLLRLLLLPWYLLLCTS